MAQRRNNNSKKVEATVVAKEELATEVKQVQQPEETKAAEETETTEATEVAEVQTQKVSIFTKVGNTVAKVGNGISTTAKKIWASKPVQIGEAILAVRGAIAVAEDVKGFIHPDDEYDDDEEEYDDNDYDDDEDDEEESEDEE